MTAQHMRDLKEVWEKAEAKQEQILREQGKTTEEIRRELPLFMNPLTQELTRSWVERLIQKYDFTELNSKDVVMSGLYQGRQFPPKQMSMSLEEILETERKEANSPVFDMVIRPTILWVLAEIALDAGADEWTTRNRLAQREWVVQIREKYGKVFKETFASQKARTLHEVSGIPQQSDYPISLKFQRWDTIIPFEFPEGEPKSMKEFIEMVEAGTL